MSRFLRSNKLLILVLGVVLTTAFFLLKWYIAFVLLLICGLFVLLVFHVDRRTSLPLLDLNNQRPVRKIDTIIIGDCCSRKVLANYFDLNHSLIIQAPDRGVKASFLILQHVASRLDGKDVCIIAPRREKAEINQWDAPYLSQITKLEMNIKSEPFIRLTHLLTHPGVLIKFFISPLVKPREVKSSNEELLHYCTRKGFRLTFLQK